MCASVACRLPISLGDALLEPLAEPFREWRVQSVQSQWSQRLTGQHHRRQHEIGRWIHLDGRRMYGIRRGR